MKGVQAHQLNQWMQSGPVMDMVHLNDRFRVRMVQAVVRHFRGEQDSLETWSKNQETLSPYKLKAFIFT